MVARSDLQKQEQLYVISRLQNGFFCSANLSYNRKHLSVHDYLSHVYYLFMFVTHAGSPWVHSAGHCL
jgi:hypothetical protein